MVSGVCSRWFSKCNSSELFSFIAIKFQWSIKIPKYLLFFASPIIGNKFLRHCDAFQQISIVYFSHNNEQKINFYSPNVFIESSKLKLVIKKLNKIKIPCGCYEMMLPESVPTIGQKSERMKVGNSKK